MKSGDASSSALRSKMASSSSLADFKIQAEYMIYTF